MQAKWFEREVSMTVKVIWRKTASLPQTNRWFNHIRQVAPMCLPMCADWCQLANTIELVFPSAHPSPQFKWQIDRFGRSCTAHGRKSPYLQWVLLSSKIAPSNGGISTPSNTWVPWAHQSPQPERHLDWFSCFCRADLSDRLTDRPTDHATQSVTIGCICVCSVGDVV